MKQALIHFSLSVFIVFSFLTSNAKTYYFSNNSGNDTRTSTQSQSQSTPWKTVAKLNSFMASLVAGDSVLFKSGEIFYGSMIVTKSGSTSLPIIFASYGSGNRPTITGFQTLTNWVSIGNGIYESYNSTLSTTVNTIIFNGSMQPMGRYPNITAPNKGYLTFESHNTNSITDLQLTSAINWTGAEVVIRPKRWILDRSKVTSHSGNTISFSPALTYNPYDKYGYFIQNHIKTLDQLGEWYYNPATKKMNVYFGSNNPSSYTVQASAVGTIVTINNQNNIVFNNLSFNGSNAKAFDLYYAQNIVIQYCAVMYSGIDGIDASATTNLSVKNSYFNFTNNNAIDLNYNCANSIIRYNYVANTGMAPGMGLGGNGTYQAITIIGNNNLAEYNTIYNTGYAGIRFSSGNSNLIKNNFINFFTLTKADGGGIYSGEAKGANYIGQKVTGNIILNGIGAPEGTDEPDFRSSNGIFLDDNCSNVDVSSNTVANCGRSGILLHNAYAINVQNNLLYNNLTQLTMIHDYAMPGALLRNMVVKNNICVARTDSQVVSNVRTEANDISLLGVMDSNYFCRPVDDNLTMTSSCTIAGLRVDRYHDLANWKATYNLDKASDKSPLQIPPYITNSFTGSNKYSNGTFNANTSGLYTSPSSSWVSNKLDGGTFQATNSSSTFSTYSVIIGVGSISTSKNYILRFSSQASRDTIITAYLRLSNAPYSRISDSKIIPISTKRTENEYLFTLPASTSSGSVIFETKCPKLTYWLDNVQLYEANISLSNPDDYIVFEYNITQQNKTVALSGTYRDVANKTYSGSIVIPPYSSVVLIKLTPFNMPITFQPKKIDLNEYLAARH